MTAPAFSTAGGLDVRPMRWWDIDAVLPLERELFPAEPWTAELFWSELAGVPAMRHYLIAESASTPGLPVGYAGLATAGGASSAAEVQTLAVRRDAQRRGVASRLLTALLDEARRRGSAAVLLEVRADNLGAQALYAGFGFERIGVRRGYYSRGRVDALVLRRRMRGEAAYAVPPGGMRP